MYHYNLTMYYNDNCDPANENDFDKNPDDTEFYNMLEKFKKFEKNTLTTIIKIQSPWYVTIPDGYSLLSMPVPYNDDSRFTAATGLLKGSNYLNIQLYWHRINSKEKIEKGTPLCYYLVMKDEIFTEEISEINDEDAFKIQSIQEKKRIEKKI